MLQAIMSANNLTQETVIAPGKKITINMTVKYAVTMILVYSVNYFNVNFIISQLNNNRCHY